MENQNDLEKRLLLSSKTRELTIRDIDESIEIAKVTLELPEGKISKEENQRLRNAYKAINENKNDLIEILDEFEREIMRKWFENPDDRYAIAHVSDFSDRFSEMRRAFEMQEKERGKNERREAALIAAISAEHGTGAARHPNKEAGAILDAVNRRLESVGLKPVKIDVVRRRLEQWPALLKSAEGVTDFPSAPFKSAEQ
jgi:hypothetical protein